MARPRNAIRIFLETERADGWYEVDDLADAIAPLFSPREALEYIDRVNERERKRLAKKRGKPVAPGRKVTDRMSQVHRARRDQVHQNLRNVQRAHNGLMVERDGTKVRIRKEDNGSG